MGFLRSTGLAVHGVFARNAKVARVYLELWSVVLRWLPEIWLKTHLRNNLLTAPWPSIVFAPRRMELGEKIYAQLRPRSESVTFASGMFHQPFGHEPEVFRFLQPRLGRYAAVVEIGANVGAYTVFFSKCLDSRTEPPRPVFSFEPSRQAFADLLEHLRLNGCRNVQAINGAVWNKAGLSPFFGNSNDWMKGSLDPEAAGRFSHAAGQTENVITVGGADVASMVPKIGRLLLKVDVVGSEATVLTALSDVVRDRLPDLVIGVWYYNLPSLNSLNIAQWGYKLYKIETENLAPRTCFVDRDYCNYFATVEEP